MSNSSHQSPSVCDEGTEQGTSWRWLSSFCVYECVACREWCSNAQTGAQIQSRHTPTHTPTLKLPTREQSTWGLSALSHLLHLNNNCCWCSGTNIDQRAPKLLNSSSMFPFLSHLCSSKLLFFHQPYISSTSLFHCPFGLVFCTLKAPLCC